MESKKDVKENGTADSTNDIMDNITDVKTMFEELHKKALAMGIKQHQFGRLQFVKNTRQAKRSRIYQLLLQVTLAFSATLVACLITWQLDWPVSRNNFAQIFWQLRGTDSKDISSEQCLAKISKVIYHLARPPLDCGFCKNVKEIARVSNITSSEFEDKYAYTALPVVISDGAANWSAKDIFSFDFFKGIYWSGSPVFESENIGCQFLSFVSEFQLLEDVFEMDESRATNKDGTDPWYIGWSNCDVHAGNILRQHYSRPYFLPPESEDKSNDWIFMGTPGYGALMHVDHVNLPSWQAQIVGHKEWTLAPPPECYFECGPRMTVTVHPGEIIVLDTNKWYHATRVVGDTFSITIGAEYD